MARLCLLQRLESIQTAPSQVEDGATVVDSILANLRGVLNSRKGCCAIRPDYGLHAFDPTADDFRNSIARTAGDIEEQIRQFEPRLGNVVVRAIEDQNRPQEILFQIRGELAHPDKAERVALTGAMGGDGQMRLHR
jgi:type VI secretion system protein